MLRAFKDILLFLALMWGTFLLSNIIDLRGFGIIPRTSVGLIGIVTSPFLHGNFEHILSNSIGLLTFAPLFILLERKRAISKITLMALGTGLLTWGLARDANHIGASGLIFSLYGYLISRGFFKKRVGYMILSLFLLLSYGYMIFGVFPIQRGVSWESHLFGLIAGILLARFR